MERERKQAEEKARLEAEARALAARRERERIDREEKERAEREEKERAERERKEKMAARGGIRGVRGTRASMRGARTSQSSKWCEEMSLPSLLYLCFFALRLYFGWSSEYIGCERRSHRRFRKNPYKITQVFFFKPHRSVFS
jgi:hypothetical protein